MKVITKNEFDENIRKQIVEEIRRGTIFIYPTDTIYGLGCNATNVESVRRIREIKHRPDEKPFSVIAPNKEWILQHCVVVDSNVLNKLPGPYTLIFKLKEGSVATLFDSSNKKYPCGMVAQGVNVEGTTLGVRMINHWFQEIISLAGIPFVTTSVNISGEKHLEDPNNVPNEISRMVDYTIDDGIIHGVSSTKIDCTI